MKILGQSGIGNESLDIGKGKTGSTIDDMTTFRIGFDAISVDPGYGSRHHTKVQVIGHRIGVANLAFPPRGVPSPDFSPGFGILGQVGKAGWTIARRSIAVAMVRRAIVQDAKPACSKNRIGQSVITVAIVQLT